MSYQISKSEDGFAPFKYANAPEHLQTYFRIVGDLTPFSIPLICIHGGPGLTHHYLLNHSLLSESSNIPIIFYDQIGSGLSTHFPQSTSPSLFTVDLFLSELSQLISHLTARYSFTKYSILGSSWGGMLSSCFAASLQPPNLHKLILANAPASKALSTQNRNLYRKALTQEQQQILDSCEREGKCRTEAYQEVLDVFFKTHICNVEPPQEFLESFRFSKEDRTVINAM
jgi:proline-specific peptidase